MPDARVDGEEEVLGVLLEPEGGVLEAPVELEGGVLLGGLGGEVDGGFCVGDEIVGGSSSKVYIT